MNKIKDTLAKTSNDWKVRIEALQMMRALLMAGADQYDEMMQALRTLEVPFQSSVKDLRSQVDYYIHYNLWSDLSVNHSHGHNQSLQ